MIPRTLSSIAASRFPACFFLTRLNLFSPPIMSMMSPAATIPRRRRVPVSVTGSLRKPHSVIFSMAPMMVMVGGTETTSLLAMAMIPPPGRLSGT